MAKIVKETIHAKGIDIGIYTTNFENEFISLTDIAKYRNEDDPRFVIQNWMRNRNTIEFLGIWEELHNPNFNYGEFAIIKSQAGLNSYKLSVKEWVNKTNSIGIVAKTGRYGGTYAHKDIAFEFGMWISPKFKLLLIKEFERLKSEEQKQLGWDAKRELSKINYKIHTDAIKKNLIPKELTKYETSIVYAEEADVLNMALFGMTAKQWRDKKYSKEEIEIFAIAKDIKEKIASKYQVFDKDEKILKMFIRIDDKKYHRKYYDRIYKTGITQEQDEYYRKAYSGGITIVQPGKENKEYNKIGFSFDVNSEYPAVMMQNYPDPSAPQALTATTSNAGHWSPAFDIMYY